MLICEYSAITWIKVGFKWRSSSLRVWEGSFLFLFSFKLLQWFNCLLEMLLRLRFAIHWAPGSGFGIISPFEIHLAWWSQETVRKLHGVTVRYIVTTLLLLDQFTLILLLRSGRAGDLFFCHVQHCRHSAGESVHQNHSCNRVTHDQACIRNPLYQGKVRHGSLSCHSSLIHATPRKYLAQTRLPSCNWTAHIFELRL